jgi:hypothetical protein
MFLPCPSIKKKARSEIGRAFSMEVKGGDKICG